MREPRSWTSTIELVVLSAILAIAHPAATQGERRHHPPGPKVTVINTRDQAVPTWIVDGQPAPKDPFQKEVSTIPTDNDGRLVRTACRGPRSDGGDVEADTRRPRGGRPRRAAWPR